MPSMNALHFFGPRCCMNFLHIVWQTSRISCASPTSAGCTRFPHSGQKTLNLKRTQGVVRVRVTWRAASKVLKNNGQNSTKSPKNIEKAALIHSYDKFNCVVYACKPYPILPRIFLVIVMTWQPQKRRLQKSSCENSDECWEARKATAKTTAMNFVHYSINSCQNLERKWP